MKNEEGQKSESSELVPREEPRAGKGVDARSFPFDTQADSADDDGREPPRLGGGNGGGQGGADTSASSAAAVLPSTGLEILGSDEGPPLRMGMIGTIDGLGSSGGSWLPNGAGKPRVEIDGDDARPPPPPSMMESSLDDVGIPAKYLAPNDQDQTAKAGSHPEHANGDTAPTPLNYAEFDDDDGHHAHEKKPAARASKDEEAGLNGQEAEPSSEDSICEPGNEEPDDRALSITRGPADTAHRINYNRQQLSVDDLVQGEEDADAPGNNTSAPDPERDSVIQVPVAWAVSGSNVEDTNEEWEEAVIIAAPLEPSLVWWKQLNARRFFAFVCALSIAGAVAFGILFSRDNSSPETVAEVSVVFASSPPSTSITPTTSQPTTAIPTVQPTTSPSGSILPSTSPSAEPTPSPSSSPTECARQISSQVQTIDLQVSYLWETPEVAVDGQNMVAIVQDLSASVTYTKFYSLRNDEWIVKNTFIGDANPRSVGLSGKTAFVGLASALFNHNFEEDVVSVYEQNLFGDWEKADDPFVHDDNVSHVEFGLSAGFDEDLACVADLGEIHLLRQVGTKWVQLDTIKFWGGHRQLLDGEQLLEEDIFLEEAFLEELDSSVFEASVEPRVICSISGDTVAIASHNSDSGSVLQLYNYNADLGGVVPLQDPISAFIGRMDLSNNHLVFSTRSDIFIYRREDADQTFALHQQTGHSYYGGFIPYAFEKDILAIGDNYHTRIFSERDGRWEETFSLDQSYSDYQLSSRTLLAANETGLYSFNIEDCVQLEPTSKPSASPSLSPSASPSMRPSQSPSSTLSPSSSPSWPPSMPPSSSLSPTETCFFVEIDVLTDWNYYETWWDISSVTTVNGTQAKNVVYDSSTIEIRMEGATFSAAHVLWSATDTSANGALCDCGGEIGLCDCLGRVCLIEKSGYWFYDALISCEDGGGVAAIIYNNVDEPLWSPRSPSYIPAAFISQVDGRYLLEHGLGKVVSMTASSSLQFEREALHSRRVCLPEGNYEFIIYDAGGDGIFSPGGYEVTSNGATIAQGDIGSKAAAAFPLPTADANAAAKATVDTNAAAKATAAPPPPSEPDMVLALYAKYEPFWMTSREGWNGGSHSDAVSYCTSFGGKGLCPYAFVCPHGPGGAVIGVKAEGEQYVPVIGSNHWVMIGDVEGEDGESARCRTHRQLERRAPEWGMSGDRAEVKRHIYCCTVQ